jgi:hypothetical protein
VIDDEVGEFSTPLKFISDNWGLDPLTKRIAKAHNFEHVFDFTKPPRPPVSGTKKAKTYTDDPYENPGVGYPGWPEGTGPAGLHPVGGWRPGAFRSRATTNASTARSRRGRR